MSFKQKTIVMLHKEASFLTWICKVMRMVSKIGR